MELTISRLFPGATARANMTSFTVLNPEYPYILLETPTGIRVLGRAFEWQDIGSRPAAYPESFERAGRDRSPYRLRGQPLWGQAFAGNSLLALWTARDATEEHSAARLAVAEIDAVLKADGSQEQAAFMARMSFGVNVRWTLQDFPPYTDWGPGRGWRYLEGYWKYQTELLKR